MVAIGKQNEKLRIREHRSNLQVIRKWLIRGSWAFVSTNGLLFSLRARPIFPNILFPLMG